MTPARAFSYALLLTMGAFAAGVTLVTWVLF